MQKGSRKNIYFCFIDYAKAFDSVDHNTLWKILKDTEIPDHLSFLLRNLYAGQEATARTGRAATDWFQMGKGVHQGCILSPCLFNLYAEYIMRNAGLEEPEIKLPTSAGSSKKQESSRKTSISALLTMPKPLTVWITTNCGKF